ncbi:MAG: BON domain-containing protein [Alkalimonas sp.]|nr:BON domain-containing protein [Alkalimonas sp.]
MKTRNVYALFLISLLSLVLLGCGATTTRASTGEYIDDTVITTKVKAAIFNHESLKVNEISVETFKGEVQLGGFVSSAAQIPIAMRLAREVNGVIAVKNNMQVK